jgi:DNA-binding CsgD family transcriptional regulator
MQLCSNWAELEIVSGRFDDARRWAEEGLALVEETDARQNRATMLCDLAAIEAYEGNHDAARRLGEETKAISESVGDVLFARKARDILCFVELSGGRPDAALAEFGDPRVDVWRLPFSGDKVEALIGVGRTQEAEAELLRLEQRAVRGPRVVKLLAQRCCGLFTLATGDLPTSIQQLEQALALARALPFPLERGRSLLALGAARRRAKQKRAARDALEEARATFAALGSKLWAERAEEELGRIGGRTAERWELTPTEQRVADLVAQGLANKEVAAALVVSVRAVEANLTRIYAKLGIRSRTELAHLLARK